MTLPFRRIVLALFTRHLSSKFTALQPATSRGDVAARITVHGGGKQIEAAWDPAPESIPSTYHSVWLRHNCQCSQCLSPSGQKVVVSAELDPNVTVTEASITGDYEQGASIFPPPPPPPPPCYPCNYSLASFLSYIRESVDSLCRDDADMPMPPYIRKACNRPNAAFVSLFR